MEISKKIALARKNKGLTQEQLADQANVTVRTIQRIESGESIPRSFTIKTLAEALEINFEDLLNEVHNGNSLKDTGKPKNKVDSEKEKHFLKILCLSSFSYLVIPLLHFLIPVYLLKRSGSTLSETIAFGRTVIRQQIWWVTVLCFLMILTLAYNFIATIYFKKFYLHYLWPFFVMYILNAIIIVAAFRRIDTLDFTSISTT